MTKYLLPLFLLIFIQACKTSNDLAINGNATSTFNSKEAFKKGIVTPKEYKDLVGDTLKVLSWNLEHFLDDYDNPYTNNQRENNKEGMQDRVELLIDALRKADADVVVFQEFESVQFLKQIADNSLSDLGYQFFADHESIDWYMNVVVMSRVPLGIMYGYGAVTTPVEYIDEKTGEKKYETQSMINTRMWSVDVLVNEDYSFLLTGVHLKAGRGARNEAMRLGQINFLKGQFERFYRENPSKNMLIVGDFNCTPESNEFKTLLDGDSPVQFVDNLSADAFSHPADDPKWRIDHLLPNEAMQKELINGSLEVKYYFEKDVQRSLSDHLPLVANFLTTDTIIE